MPFLSSLDRDEEVPVTSTPIFEGHLSIRTEKKHWQWRLFRFDGSNFTCLSTRKIKIPPNHNSTSMRSIESSYSLTSPLLATPKDKNKRLVESTSNNKTELKYYQLPEWTIDVANISAISVLKRAKKNALQQSSSKCFSIRTFDQKYYILKAQKQKDLERWLFVLTKMWKFTQAVKNQVQQLQQQQQQQQFYYPTLSNATAAAAAAAHQVAQVQAQAQQVQQQQQQAAVQAAVDDNIPLVHSIQQFPKPPALSDEKIKVIEEWRKSLAELMASDPCIKVSTPPPIEPIPDDDTMSVFTDMTSVSNRPKSMKRRGNSKRSATSRSLRRNKTNSIAPAAGAASSSNQHQELPLEGRPGPTLRKRRSDDVRNWMNNGSSSNSHGNKQTPVLNRAASTSSRRRKPMIQKLSTTDLYQQVPLNNYYLNSNNKQYYYNANSQLNSSTSPEIIQHMNFFQDVITVCDDEVCPYEHHQHNSSVHQQQQQQQDDNKLRYHTSVRGKKLIQVNQGEDSMPAGITGAVGGRSECKEEGGDANPCNENVQLKIEEKQQQQQQQQQCTYTEQGEQLQQPLELGGELGLLSSPNQDNINIMRRPTIITRRASMPLTDDNLLMQQQYQQQYQQYQQQQQYLFDQHKMNALSPLQFLSLTATKKELEKYKSANQAKAEQNDDEEEDEEEEEDMSLADLQKSLRQVGLQQQQHTRSPSASSIHDLQKRSSRYLNSPSIVAPAIPPHQYIQQQQQQFHQHHPQQQQQQQQLYLFDYDQQKQLKQQQIQQQYHHHQQHQQQQQKLKMFLPSTSSSHLQQQQHHYSNNIYP